jgi:hypothetical protein
MIDNKIHNPSHYTQGEIECIDAIRSALGSEHFVSYCQGNTIKYLWRFWGKNKREDLEKAKVYIDYMITEINSEK